MFDFSNDKKLENDGIQNMLNCLNELENLMYTEEMADIDRKRAEHYKNFFISMLADCDGNTDKEQAFKDVIYACIILEQKQNLENSALLDTKLRYAEKYI